MQNNIKQNLVLLVALFGLGSSMASCGSTEIITNYYVGDKIIAKIANENDGCNGGSPSSR